MSIFLALSKLRRRIRPRRTVIEAESLQHGSKMLVLSGWQAVGYSRRGVGEPGDLSSSR
jgi:hypothetical protein